MAFPPDFLEELRRRLPLSSVVAKRVRLTRKGREHEGLCPFHNEKSPSFFVNDDKAFYHCFGCGAHGDAIAFVMNTEGLGFPEAVERLATDAGLEVPKSAPVDKAVLDRQTRLTDAVETACVWFENKLKEPVGREALDYLKRRGLDAKDIAHFRLGFAPDGRTGLLGHLRDKGFPEELIVEAGLAIKVEDRPDAYDRFRGRVMFPIADRRGRVIAFGGRIMGDGQPKYLNSPDTPLFHKGRVLYAHHLARAASAKGRPVIVAEGYMDVVALHKAGFDGAVAPLGTALTEDQLGELWRMADEPFLCFDGDGAGQRAASRGAERALPLIGPGRSLRFVLLPGGQDPDDLVRQPGGAAKFTELLEGARPLAETLWNLEVGRAPIDTPERRAEFRGRLRALIGRITDRDVQEFYRRDFTDRQQALFGGGEDQRGGRGQGRGFGQIRGGRSSVRGGAGRKPWNASEPVYMKAAPESMGQVETGARRLQASALLCCFINHPMLGDEFLENLAGISFADQTLDTLRREIVYALADAPDLDAGALANHLVDRGLGAVLSQVSHRDVYRMIAFTEPGVAYAEVAAGVRHVLALIAREGVQADRLAAEREALAEGTPEAWARFKAMFDTSSEVDMADGGDEFSDSGVPITRHAQ